MIAIHLRCLPPSVTAQQKRLRVVRGKPVFFHGPKMRREAATWAALLRPYRPASPILGPVWLEIRLVYPHLKKTRETFLLRPKVSKPDVGNAAKHLEDLLAKLGFIDDDQQVAKLIVSKWHGPTASVGVHINLAPWGADGESLP